MGKGTKGRLVRVVLKEPYGEVSEFFFGSMKAIFDFLPPEVVGTTLYYIYHYAKFISADHPLVTDKATISYVNYIRAGGVKKGRRVGV